MSTDTAKERILITGATGYIGGSLLKSLSGSSTPIRCLTRKAQGLAPDTSIEVVEGNLLEEESLSSVFNDVSVAFYLVHSLNERGNFESLEIKAAYNFVNAAEKAGVKKIIYLGGLCEGSEFSPHLRSRHTVGKILRSSTIPTVEFRAAIILGAGSSSYQIVRDVTEVVPLLLCPRWVMSKTQPISIADVVSYLQAAIELPVEESAIFEIGGRDVVPYQDLLLLYAQLKSLRRKVILLPVLTPYLSSLWLSLVTPVHARVGRRLVEGLRHDTIVTAPKALESFAIQPKGVREALLEVFKEEDALHFETGHAFEDTKYLGLWRGARVMIGTSLPLISLRFNQPSAKLSVKKLFDERISAKYLQLGCTWGVHEVSDDSVILRKVSQSMGSWWLRIHLSSKLSTLSLKLLCEPRGLWGRVLWYALLPLWQMQLRSLVTKVSSALEENEKETVNSST